MVVVEELRDIVQEGLVHDLFRMERAYELYIAIAENAPYFEVLGRGNYRELFNTIQSSLITEAALSVARVFDPPSKKYPTRCLQQALLILRDKAKELPPPHETYNLIETLRTLPKSQSVISAIYKNSDEFAVELSTYFSSLINSSDYQQKIKNLKVFVINTLLITNRCSLKA